MTDKLRFDFINSLPQPFLARFCGDKVWWPVESIEVECALVRIAVCGKLQIKPFSEVMEIKDADNETHDPDTFYNEEQE